MCPVDGKVSERPETQTLGYQGKTYFVDHAVGAQTFKAEPETYAKKLKAAMQEKSQRAL